MDSTAAIHHIYGHIVAKFFYVVGSLFSSLDGIPFVINERLKPPPKVLYVLYCSYL